MNMEQARQTFIAESREQAQELERLLLQLESGADAEALNALFRAAHTIKGSAGLFGLDALVAFMHGVEGVLDRLRAGTMAPPGELVAALLACVDHIVTLVDLIAAGTPEPDAETRAVGAALTERLRPYAGAVEDPAGARAAHAPDGPTAQTGCWHISLRFGRDVLRNGMDPLAFLRYLKTLGELRVVETLFDGMPAPEAMDPESCYLGFEIAFRSEASKDEIAAAFEFVRDDADIRILPPHSRIADYIELIRKLPEEDLRIGEILVRCGTLTEQELKAALSAQAREQATPGAGRARPLGEILVEQKVAHAPVVEAAAERQKQVREGKSAEGRFIRIQADKLDGLINLVGELVTAGDATNLHAQRLNDEGLHETASVIARLVSEIRDSALALRMVPIGETFNRFQRVVHDVSKELGKDIALEVSGKETDLDKSVIERIGDPLMHLVRNAMDHGIEEAEVRRARGKPAQGRVRLDARHDAGSIVIEVGDDGGGLDREKIFAKARERGLVDASQELTDEQVYKLVFEPGFSTAEQVTNLSGRGVGMDVVRRNIEALRGTVEIESRAGAGTTFRIRLPLTLAIIDGFLMGVAGASFVTPLDMVVECVELSEIERRALRGRDYLNLRGEVLPFLRLRELFELRGDDRRQENVVVVQYGGRKAGILVDELLGEFQTVIKPLGRIFQHLRGVSGSTILGSGEVALILDVPALVGRAASAEHQTHAGQARRTAGR